MSAATHLRAEEAEEGVVAALTHEGAGVVRGGKTVFVAGALPGETIRYRRVRRRRQYDEGELLEVLAPSATRVTPRCRHFSVCGGCALQHLSPDAQLAAKEAELREALERIGGVEPREWLAPLRGPVWQYRRRARLGARYVTKRAGCSWASASARRASWPTSQAAKSSRPRWASCSSRSRRS